MRTFAALLSVATLILVGCAPSVASPTASPPPTFTPTLPPTPTPTQTPTQTPTATPTPTPMGYVAELRVDVLNTYPHDTAAFTQGLVWANGLLYESTGFYAVTLREIDLETGTVIRSTPRSEDYFGEGLALVGNEFIQLTWTEQTAFRYDLTTFELLGTFSYTGEGWGLCFDGTSLYMSDGTSRITLRDPQTFEPTSFIEVTLNGQPVTMLNELECVGGSIYANVWLTDDIVQIDKTTGNVIGVIDASGLLTDEERAAAGNDGVLNGIAYVPERDTFLITGKLWPKLFEVKFTAIP